VDLCSDLNVCGLWGQPTEGFCNGSKSALGLPVFQGLLAVKNASRGQYSLIPGDVRKKSRGSPFCAIIRSGGCDAYPAGNKKRGAIQQQKIDQQNYIAFQ